MNYHNSRNEILQPTYYYNCARNHACIENALFGDKDGLFSDIYC